jgi:hypothetical protein
MALGTLDTKVCVVPCHSGILRKSLSGKHGHSTSGLYSGDGSSCSDHLYLQDGNIYIAL